MVKQSNLEIKVGAFVLFALICLTVFIFSISDYTVFEEGKTIKVVFNFANGLKKSAPVRIAGVDEGIIKNVEVFFDDKEMKSKVAVSFKVRTDTMIPSDSTFMINQLGLLGEKYLEVLPGEDRVNFIKPGDVAVGKDPISQEEISNRVVEITKKLEKTVDIVNTSILSEKNQESLAMSLENFGKMSGGINDVVDQLNSGKGTLGRFLYDDGLYEELEGFTSDLRANPWKLLYKPKEKRK